jgi:hypothetical protein
LLTPVLGITGEHDFIKGFKFDVAFPLSEYFTIFQSWEIPNSGIKEEGNNMMQMMMGRGGSKPNFTFMTQVAQGVSSPVEQPGTVLVAKADSEGRVDSILIKRLSNRLNLKMTANFMNSKTEDGALGADLEYEDNDSSAVFKLNHHPMQGLVGGLNYMQRVHRNVMLGFDFTHLVLPHLFSSHTRSNSSAMAASSSSEITPSTHLRSKVAPSITSDISSPSEGELPSSPTIRWKLRAAPLPSSA